MEGIIAIMATPFILFMIFVAPIWVILHYRSKSKISEGLSEEDTATIRELAAQAERMQERIRTLESILDAEHANWRHKTQQ